MSDKLLITDTRTSQEYEIPIHNNVIEASSLGKITHRGDNSSTSEPIRILDPGFRITAVKKTRVCELDKDTGDIRYRGHSIRDLVNQNDYDEVMHLLVMDKLPTLEEKVDFRRSVVSQMNPPEAVINTIKSMPKKSPSFAMLMAGLSVWNAHHHELIPVAVGANIYQSDNQDNKYKAMAIYRTIAAVTTTVALVSCHVDGQEMKQPMPDWSVTRNLLYMCGKITGLETNQDTEQLLVSALSKIMIVSADHEMTNSTAAFLHATSTGADPMSAAIASLGSGFGPLHGGAIQMAYRQYSETKTVENVPAMIEEAKKSKTRIAGLGHRVWKDVEDPRLTIVRRVMEEIPGATEQSLVAIALEVDRLIAIDPFFVKRKIKSNVDLFNCFAYTAVGFDPTVAPLIAALARLSGCLAHWKEQLDLPPCLWRPTAVFHGGEAAAEEEEKKKKGEAGGEA